MNTPSFCPSYTNAYDRGRFLGAIFGSGGLVSIARNKSSARAFACAGGSNSIDRNSAAVCAADGFDLVIFPSVGYGVH